jgi:NADH pyrophosphatase NudC (nudix superfamily)
VVVWVAALMLVASVALFVAAPLTEVFSTRRRDNEDGADRAHLEHECGLATSAIRELDFDHAMGKIVDSEFQTLRSRLETRALAAMADLERIQKGNRIESERSSSKMSQLSSLASETPYRPRFCPQCGAQPAPTHKFCSDCGTALSLSSGRTAHS